jgi:GAF domain-containing protein
MGSLTLNELDVMKIKCANLELQLAQERAQRLLKEAQERIDDLQEERDNLMHVACDVLLEGTGTRLEDYMIDLDKGKLVPKTEEQVIPPTLRTVE